MPSLSTILVLWSILAPLAMYGWHVVELADAERAAGRRVTAAVTETKADQLNVCNGRVATIASKLSTVTAEVALVAREAGERETELRIELAQAKTTADKIGATDADVKQVRAVVERLCLERSSCREHATLKARLLAK